MPDSFKMELTAEALAQGIFKIGEWVVNKVKTDPQSVQTIAPSLVYTAKHQAEFANVMSLVRTKNAHAHRVLTNVWFPSIQYIFHDMQITIHDQICDAGKNLNDAAAVAARNTKRGEIADDLIAIARRGQGRDMAADNLLRNYFAHGHQWGTHIFEHQYLTWKAQNYFARPAAPVVPPPPQNPGFLEVIAEMLWPSGR